MNSSKHKTGNELVFQTIFGAIIKRSKGRWIDVLLENSSLA